MNHNQKYIIKDCRMYPNKYPEIGEIVHITYKQFVPDLGVYVNLDEYGDLEGTIYISQLTKKKRHRSIKKLCPITKTDVATVIDIGNNIISLSKWDLGQDEIENCFDYFKKSQQLYNIIKKVAIADEVNNLNEDNKLFEICEKTVWPVYTKCQIISEDTETDIHPLDIFQDMKKLMSQSHIPDYLMNYLVNNHTKLFGINVFEANLKCKLLSYEINGLDSLKNILNTISSKINNKYSDYQLSIILTESPVYTFKIVIKRDIHELEKIQSEIINLLENYFHDRGYYKLIENQIITYREE